MKIKQRKRIRKAFSLLELSVVILIIAILATTVMSVSIGVIRDARDSVTKDRMKEIYKAMGEYLAANHRLPCPASAQLVNNNASYGLEVECNKTLTSAAGIWQSEQNPNVVYGMIPIKALKLSKDMAEDGFGSKFAYVILKGYTSSATFGVLDASNYTGNGSGYVYNADSLDSSEDNKIRIHQKDGSSVTRLTASGMFVLISYGANKSCAFPANSTSQNSASTDADEILNCASLLDTPNQGKAYFYNYSYPSALPFLTSSNSETFDDILFYKTRKEMVSDFNLLNLIQCEADTSTNSYNYYGAVQIAWPAAKYGQIVSGYQTINLSTVCPVGYTAGPMSPTRKCVDYGNWENVLNPCLQNGS